MKKRWKGLMALIMSAVLTLSVARPALASITQDEYDNGTGDKDIFYIYVGTDTIENTLQNTWAVFTDGLPSVAVGGSLESGAESEVPFYKKVTGWNLWEVSDCGYISNQDPAANIPKKSNLGSDYKPTTEDFMSAAGRQINYMSAPSIHPPVFEAILADDVCSFPVYAADGTTQTGTYTCSLNDEQGLPFGAGKTGFWLEYDYIVKNDIMGTSQTLQAKYLIENAEEMWSIFRRECEVYGNQVLENTIKLTAANQLPVYLYAKTGSTNAINELDYFQEIRSNMKECSIDADTSWNEALKDEIPYYTPEPGTRWELWHVAENLVRSEDWSGRNYSWDFTGEQGLSRDTWYLLSQYKTAYDGTVETEYIGNLKNYSNPDDLSEENSYMRYPILEKTYVPINYTIDLYDVDGNIAEGINGTITLSVENHTNVPLPTDMEAEYWKLVYNDTDVCQADNSEEIWAGIETIGGTFDPAKAKIVACATPKDGTATFTQPGWYVGETQPAPTVKSDTNGTENITYSYKVKGADDSTYTTTVPTNAGSYTAKAVFPANVRYNEVSVTSDFSISYLPVPADGYTISGNKGTDGWYHGAVTITPKSGFKIRKAADSSWADKISITDSQAVNICLMSDSGALTREISLGEFRIDTTAPTFDGEGAGIRIEDNTWKKLLENITFELFYRESKNVTIQAEDAQSGIAGYEYLVSGETLSLSQLENSTSWKQGNNFTMRTDAGTRQIVYARVTNKAGLVSYISSDGMVYDTTAPVISGVADDSTYYGESLTITVKDDYLKRVTVNEKEVEVSGGKAVVTLEASEEAYTITAEDKVGNQTSYTFYISESWLRDGITGNGRKKLKNGTEYKLGSGQWKVTGDDTVYAGGHTFYVTESGEYDFTKQ